MSLSPKKYMSLDPISTVSRWRAHEGSTEGERFCRELGVVVYIVLPVMP